MEYQAVYHRGPSTCETDYWNSFMSSNSATFRNLAVWLADYGRRTGARVTGSLSYLDQGDAVGYYFSTVNTYDVTPC
jgi:hypothetical protein